MNILSCKDILEAKKRISNYIIDTDVISNTSLDDKHSNKFFFKLDNLQKTGSFKARGAYNHLLYLKEHDRLPKKVVAVSSGNHGTAISYICAKLGIEALIYTSRITSEFKIKAMRNFGAKVVVTKERSQANNLAEKKINDGYHFIHPSNDDLVIAGQGTIFLESHDRCGDFDNVFAPCGGGGLISGIYLASQSVNNKPKIFAVEPENAADAKKSIEDNQIFAFKESPNTIADGARTLAITENTFNYLKKINAILTATEEEIIFWTNELQNILKSRIEPTSAMTMAGCVNWIKKNNVCGEKILIIISGGNH